MRRRRHNVPSFGLAAQDSVPDIIVNGCYASAELLAIDDYVRYRVRSNNLNEKNEILLTTTLTISGSFFFHNCNGGGMVVCS